ncbi:MAG: hypothetical protein H6673_12190 [Anaerolineales bacterium]|uniref:Uncharacterized protein n=1 Tax=Phototrophicus methaneseepsis TaxID=2710758 RepID=A0A7S8E9U9_9CHLR|nr:hypothetical protein [Phototrophicus methaneseepsis]MCB9437726.1 hypothetical protein [Anaerolineales bacterium]QPC83015.1 hypothetical protein G4Y79_01170 [Phototrophicus methaneseepsis]
MSKVVEAARQFKPGRDFEWMLEPDWDPSDEHRAHYVELSFMMVAEKLDIEEDYSTQEIESIINVLDGYLIKK